MKMYLRLHYKNLNASLLFNHEQYLAVANFLLARVPFFQRTHDIYLKSKTIRIHISHRNDNTVVLSFNQIWILTQRVARAEESNTKVATMTSCKKLKNRKLNRGKNFKAKRRLGSEHTHEKVVTAEKRPRPKFPATAP